MKHLFAYIKENGLKDPEDGRFFIPDKKMAKIFGNEKLRSFGMSKFIGEHLSKIDIETVDDLQEIKENVFVDKSYLVYRKTSFY